MTIIKQGLSDWPGNDEERRHRGLIETKMV